MKVFGTGWQRTGTTSLSKALKALGIRTLDFPSDLLADLDHEVIRRYDGFTDNPIPLVYRELDRRHPGSKFVHTQRDEEEWLTSVQWLFEVGSVKFEWSKRPIIGEIHQRLYGTTTFERELFLERYRRHNREVPEHFAGRPRDLLVLDLSRGDGYEKLCPFLGIDPPATPFPHWNKRENPVKVRLRKLWRLLGS
jgi:hypothetical protein